MARIVEAAESGVGRGDVAEGQLEATGDAVFGDAIAVAACEVGRRLGAAALCCFTRTGDTALRLARQRSPLPLLAFAHDDEVRARMAFSWGIDLGRAGSVGSGGVDARRGESGAASAWACAIPVTSSWWSPAAAAAWPATPTRCGCYASNDVVVQGCSDQPCTDIVGRVHAVLEVGDLGAQAVTVSRPRQLGAQCPLGRPALAHLAHDRRDPDDGAGVVAQQGHAELDREPTPVLVGGRHAQQRVAVLGDAGGHRLLVALPVPVAQLVGDDQVEAGAQRVVGRDTRTCVAAPAFHSSIRPSGSVTTMASADSVTTACASHAWLDGAAALDHGAFSLRRVAR